MRKQPIARAVALLLMGVPAALALPSPAAGQGKDKSVVATCESLNGALLKKLPLQKEDLKGGPLLAFTRSRWEPISAGDAVTAGSYLVSLPKAELLSADKNVRLILLADIGQRGPFPVLETAVQLLDPGQGADMALQFDRGLIALVNEGEKPATVRIKVQDTVSTLQLLTPKTKVVLELYSRHPPGLPTVIDENIGEPLTSAAILMAEGQVFLKTPRAAVRLEAPPGPAVAVWDSLSREFTVDNLEKLPEDLGPLNKEEQAKFDMICSCAGKLNKGDLDKTIADFLKSDSEVDRRVGVTILGAVDRLPQLIQSLSDKEHPEVRDQAVLVLRHWMGRQKGQVVKLFGTLVKGGFTLPEAKTIVQLLFGFSYADRREPLTYELLIAGLDHSEPAVRELSHWHLVRLAPAGAGIPYDAMAPEPRRAEAVRQWQELIPPGQLPPPPKKVEGK